MKRISLHFPVALAVAMAAMVFPVKGQGVIPVQSDKLIRLDSDEKLAAQLGEDRLMKYLVRSAQPGAESVRISVPMMEHIVAASITDGTAMTDIGASLAMGDINLRDAVTSFLKSLNFTQQQIDDTVNAWAEGRPPQALSTIVSNAASRTESIDFLVAYLLDTRNSWPKVCANVQLVLQGREPLTPLMLKTNLVNDNLVSDSQVDDLMAQAKGQSTQARLRLMFAVAELLRKTGTVASYLQSTGTIPASWYEKMWRKCETMVASDPLYLTEYVRRLRDSSYLYDQWRSVMLGALDLKEGYRFFAGYYEATGVPNGRFEYTLKFMLPEAQGVEIIGSDQDPKIKQFSDLLMAAMKGSTQWTDYIMWHLTRPAEALCLTLRASLPTVLGNSPGVCRKILDSFSSFSSPFKDTLSSTSAFSFYGSPETFRIRAAEGKLTPEALHSFGTTLGQLLVSSDQAWDNFFKRLDIGDSHAAENVKGAKMSLVAEAINSDVATTKILIRTLQSNDARLADRFATWLLNNSKSPNRDSVNHWLDLVVTQLDRGQITGNADVANFKSWFITFMMTPEGWSALQARLLIESTDVNEALRDAMVAYLMQNEPEMWKILRTTAASSGVLNFKLVPRLRDYVVRTKLNEYLLREISQQNQIATQAVYPVWPELLGPDAPTTTSIINTIQQGNILGDLYSVYATALIEAMQKNESRRILEPIIRNTVPNGTSMAYPQLFQSAVQQINVSALKAQPIIQAAMASPQIREAWRLAFLNQVRIMGKGYVVADYLLHQGELQKSWAEKLSDVLTKDPTLMEKIIYALSYRRVGDPSSSSDIDQARREIAQILLEDRIMFEQIIANKSTLFAYAFKDAVARELGAATAENWVPSAVQQ
jgi:hypothetical protein